MGGGDLNLKKSWHPLTMKNLERVWKAEQRTQAEQKRIEELQAEIKEERARDEMQQMAIDAGVMKPKEDRVDWLYKGPGTVNREEYLLGKPIDKAVDPTLIEEEREKEALANGPGALFVSSDTISSMRDLEMKIREDPLFLIRKNEEEAKKKLLDNPIKLQRLQQMLQKKKGKKKHKHHKSEKKSKSKRKHSDDDSGTDSDTKPMRYSSDVRRKEEPSSYRERRERSRSPDWRRRERNGHGSTHGRGSPHRSQPRESKVRDRSRSPIDRRRRHRSRSPDIREHRRPYGGGRRDIPHQNPSGGSGVSRKMDSAELERKRQEMMSSAKERDVEREAKVKKHREKLEKEEAEAKTKGKGDFLNPMRVKSLTSSTSLEDRIHRNINSVQRTKAALNDNFLKK